MSWLFSRALVEAFSEVSSLVRLAFQTLYRRLVG